MNFGRRWIFKSPWEVLMEAPAIHADSGITSAVLSTKGGSILPGRTTRIPPETILTLPAVDLMSTSRVFPTEIMRKHFLAFKGIARRLRVVGLLAFLFSFTFPTPAQGTIHFSNRSVTPSIAAPVIDSRTSQRLEGTAWTAALYYTRSVVSDPTLLIAAQPATHF